jgi:hypothetical protein
VGGSANEAAQDERVARGKSHRRKLLSIGRSWFRRSTHLGTPESVALVLRCSICDMVYHA